MVQCRKIVLILILLLLPFAANAAGWNDFSSASIQTPNEGGIQQLEVLINSTMKVTIPNVPVDGYLEVFSILGVKVKSISLKQCEDGCFIDLPKGIYILKVGNSTQKVIVK